jgi:hypothetical protein
MQKATSEVYLRCYPSPQVTQVISKADKCMHGCVISVTTHLVIACLHKSSDFTAMLSIVINKLMDIEQQYSGWNHLEHTLLILLAQMIR